MKFKQFIETETMEMQPPAIKPKRVLWSGIQISSQERNRINQIFAERLQPLLEQGWQQANKPPVGVPPELLPDHVTIVAMQELPADAKHLLGTEQPMRIVGWGQSDLAAAVAVESPVKFMNSQPHMTMAISPMGKPFHSNQISNWEKLEPHEQLTVKGFVIEKTA
jgi:hypothetical protein